MRALTIAAMAVATAVLFVVAAAGGLLLHTATPAARHLIVSAVNRATADLFAGTVHVIRIGRIGFGSVRGVSAVVLDAQGRVAAVVDGAGGSVRVPALVASLLRGRGDIAVVVDDARVSTLGVMLAPGPEAAPPVARAFAPRHPSAAPPSREVSVDVRSIHVQTARVQGELSSLGSLEATASDLRGTFSHDARTTRAELTHATLVARGVLPVPVAVQVSAAMELPSSGAAQARAAVEGTVGLAPVAVLGRLDGAHVEASADAPLVTPDALSALDAGVALAEPLGAHARVSGDLPTLHAIARVHAGGGAAAVTATATVGKVTRIDGSVEVAGVNPRRVVATAPDTSVSLRSDIGALLGPAGRARADARAHVTAAGLPVEATLHLVHEHRSTTLDFGAHSIAGDLSRIPELRARRVLGTAVLGASGRLDLRRQRVVAAFDARLDGVRLGADSVREGEVCGRVVGALSSPVVHAVLRASDVHAAGRTIDHLAIDVTGTPRAASVAAAVQPPHAPALLARADLALESGGRFDATGIELMGLGSPITGEAHVRRKAVDVRVQAPRVDLAAVARLAPLPPQLSGTGALDLNVRADARGATGHVGARLDVSGLPQTRRAVARVSLDLAGRRVGGDVELSLDGPHSAPGPGNGAQAPGSFVRVSLADVVLAGPPTDPSAWQRATGEVAVESAVDLPTLAGLLGDAMPVSRLAGTLSLRGHVTRAEPQGTPDVTVEASTRGLALATRASGTPTPSHVEEPEEAELPARPWILDGVDVRVGATIEGATERVSIDGSLVDRAGPLVQMQLQARPDLRELLRAPGDARTLVERTTFQAHAEMPQRDLASLPSPFRPAAMHGIVAFAVDATGPLIDPRVRLHGLARGVQPMQAPSVPRFDGDFDASYDGHAAIVRALVRRPEGVVLDARADVDAPIDALLAPGAGAPAWDADATVALHDFPLETVPPIAARGIGGIASGVFLLEGLHRDARAEADLRIAKPRLGVVCFQAGQVRASIAGGHLQASTRFAQPGSLAAATVDLTTRWGTDIVPSLDTSRPIDATLEAHDFRAAALMPFLEGAVDQLDGQVNADVRLHVEPDFKAGTVDGDVRISKAMVEVAALGEPLRDLSARISMQPWGTLRIDDLSARGTTGRVEGSAQALFDGTLLKSATAELRIPRDDRLPLTLEGVALGEAYGKINVDARVSDDRSALDVDVSVPQLNMELPATAGKAVQSLAPAPHVIIGTYDSNGRFVALPQHAPAKPREPDSLRVRAIIALGDEVRLRRDANLDAWLSGSPVVVVNDTMRVEGEIRLARGTIDVFGKRFTIDPASTVSFTGDPDNPQIVATATYAAPDGTRISADLVGTPGKMKVNLRSEPPLSQDQIVGLLLFGSDEGLLGTPAPGQQADVTQQAAGLASGIVTQGINRALQGITAIEISTRVDTSQAANPRPEVEVRLSNEVLTRITVQTGMPAPGEPRDTTLLTIDWRFKPRWSLQTTVGDAGSTFVELLWSHRY
jgi:translocation and assembly module TamB